MPDLQQLELLAAMPSWHLPDPHLQAQSGDIDNEMAGCPVCQHSKPQGSTISISAQHAKQAKQADRLRGPAADIAAFGQLVIQMYRGKMLYHAAADTK